MTPRLARLTLVLALAGPAGGVDLFVSPRGDDAGPGTRTASVRSLARARDRLRASGRLGREACTVWLAGGDYLLDESFRLEAADSGTAAAPVTWRAAPGAEVRLVGGRRLAATDFRPVTDPATRTRIRPALRDRMVGLDLASLGVHHLGPYPDRFADNGGLLELFVEGRRLPLSRYPNRLGDLTIERVLVNGGGQERPGDWRVYYNTGTPEQRRALELGPPRPGVFRYRIEHAAAHARWARVLDRGVWLKGYWRVAWQNEAVRVAAIDTAARTVTLACPVSNGIGSKYHRPAGSGQEIYGVMNLLEEIDTPGEWAVDFVDRHLYLLPPAGFERAEILLADMDEPVVHLTGARYVTLRGLTVTGGLGDGLRLDGCEACGLLGCTVRNVGHYGIWIEGGRSCEVRSCDLHGLGAGGVWLSGGDRRAAPRVAAGHRLTNCDIHHFGEVERVYAPGINVGFRGGGGGSAVLDAVGMIVTHNAVHDGPHAGVLFNGFDHVFARNEVFRYAQVSNDMGAFYCYAHTGGIGNNTFRYNWMHDSPEGDGIYYDNLAGAPTIEGNVAWRLGASEGSSRGTGFLFKNAGRSAAVFRNNLAVDCAVGFDLTLGPDSRVTANAAVACRSPLRHDAQGAGGIAVLSGAVGLPERIDLPGPVAGFQAIPWDTIGLRRDEVRRRVPDYRSSRREEAGLRDAASYEILDRP